MDAQIKVTTALQPIDYEGIARIFVRWLEAQKPKEENDHESR